MATVTVGEYARMRGMHPESVRRAIRKGRIEARKRGRGPKKPWLVKAPTAVNARQQVVTQEVEGFFKAIPAPMPQPDYLWHIPAPRPATGLAWRLAGLLIAICSTLTLWPFAIAAARGLGFKTGSTRRGSADCTDGASSNVDAWRTT